MNLLQCSMRIHQPGEPSSFLNLPRRYRIAAMRRVLVLAVL
jgi:hypothetical protein